MLQRKRSSGQSRLRQAVAFGKQEVLGAIETQGSIGAAPGALVSIRLIRGRESLIVHDVATIQPTFFIVTC